MNFFKGLTILLLIVLSVNAYSQTDEASDWNSSKSNGGPIEKIGSKLQEKLKQFKRNRKAKANAKANSIEKRSLVAVAKEWPVKNKVVTFTPFGSMLQGGSYAYIQFEKNEESIIDKVNISFSLDKDKKLKDPRSYDAIIPRMYSQNKWFFPNPMVKSYGTEAMHQIYITPNSMVTYNVPDFREPEVKNIVAVAGKKGKSQNAWIKEIEAFRRWGFKKDTTDQQDLAKAEKAFRTKYSLENKVVTNIKIIFIDDTEKKGAQVGGTIKFGIQATLDDGTTDKTQNIGGNLYIEDFVVDYAHTMRNIGDEYKNDEWGGHCHCENAILNVSAYSPAPGSKDILTFSVKSKYKGTGKESLVFPLRYNKNLKVKSVGSTVKLEARTTKHTETGQELIYVKVNNAYQKFQSGGELYCNKNGSPGIEGKWGADCSSDYCTAGNGGNGTNGGKGGIIYLTIDPNAKGKFTTKLLTRGGAAGKPGIGGHAFGYGGTNGQPGNWGKAGAAGFSTIKVAKVSF